MKKITFIFSLLMVTVFLTASLTTAAGSFAGKNKNKRSVAYNPEAEKAVSELVKEYSNRETPGGVILVMRDGAIVYNKSFGMANLSHNIPFETTTITNIGSTSKQFTGFAIALLEERGLLTLDDDIRTHIPELPDLGQTVTLRHLLSHTSGYREYINSLMMTGRKLGDLLEREEIIPLVQRQPALQSTPGEAFLYNNTGFALLSMVVERVTETPFDKWMKENVFLPLGMNHTSVRFRPGQVIAGSAQGYMLSSDSIFVETTDLGASAGAGGIYTTVADLSKWVQNFFDPKVGSHAIIEKMKTPFILNNGESSGYGLGLIAGDLKGLAYVQHGGADVAHRSSLMIFPDARGAVITQSNNAGFAGNIATKVAEAFFGDLMESAEGDRKQEGEFVYDAKKFDELAGRYALEVAPDFILEFSREGDKLFTQATRQPKFEIFASSDSTFFLKVVQASMTFHRNAEGKVDAITLHQNGDNRAKRIVDPAWTPSAEDLVQYSGRYFSEELETFYTIKVDEENVLLVNQRRLGDIPLKAEKEDEFSGTMPVYSIEFVRDDNGRVTGFLASSGRSFGILFEKQ